jgi:hypothetical protein
MSFVYKMRLLVVLGPSLKQFRSCVWFNAKLVKLKVAHLPALETDFLSGQMHINAKMLKY